MRSHVPCVQSLTTASIRTLHSSASRCCCEPVMRIVRRLLYMASVGKSAASLRIYGDDLVPEEVTRLLGCTPTRAEQKGQVIRTTSGRERTARTGGWHLIAPDSEPEGLDQQVSWL